MLSLRSAQQHTHMLYLTHVCALSHAGAAALAGWRPRRLTGCCCCCCCGRLLLRAPRPWRATAAAAGGCVPGRAAATRSAPPRLPRARLSSRRPPRRPPPLTGSTLPQIARPPGTGARSCPGRPARASSGSCLRGGRGGVVSLHSPAAAPAAGAGAAPPPPLRARTRAADALFPAPAAARGDGGRAAASVSGGGARAWAFAAPPQPPPPGPPHSLVCQPRHRLLQLRLGLLLHHEPLQLGARMLLRGAGHAAGRVRVVRPSCVVCVRRRCWARQDIRGGLDSLLPLQTRHRHSPLLSPPSLQHLCSSGTPPRRRNGAERACAGG